MKFLTFAATVLSLGAVTLAHADWSRIQNEAKGQTVYFNGVCLIHI
jgi:ABC-type uncharacterized transport system YnjBCD substrate-binding protein